MPYNRALLLVEGSTDELFFNSLIIPRLKPRYSWIGVRSYQNRAPSDTVKLIQEFASSGNLCLMTADLDNFPCVTAKKLALMKRYRGVSGDRVIIVHPEIEAWYLAGINRDSWKELGLPRCDDINAVDKQRFNKMKPKHFSSTIEFMLILLRSYSVSLAVSNSKSFGYLMDKLGLEPG